MKTMNKNVTAVFILFMVLILCSFAACRDRDHRDNERTTTLQSYPISSDVTTTRQNTITFSLMSSETNLDQVEQLLQEGFGVWTAGAGIDDGKRTDIMPASYDDSSVTQKTQLLHFFTMSDVHITDKESPSQPIYLQTLHPTVTSAYSPVMLYTTQVLDATIQTVNALHKTNPFDFGISLGDVANNTQYNELRWYIDVIDGKVITPSSGDHAGSGTIDYQKRYKAAGLDASIPWYQTLGNHDHFWVGTNPINDYLRESYIANTVIALGDPLIDPDGINKRDYYMGVIDGTTTYGDIIYAGPVGGYASPPQVTADPHRYSLTKKEWMSEFFTTSTNPEGHGFTQANLDDDFACYSFVPKSNVPIKVIVLDDTQREDDADFHGYGHGSLDKERYDWLVKELDEGQANGEMMIIAAHIPISVEYTDAVMYPAPYNTIPRSFVGWSNYNAYVTEAELITKLQTYSNLILWIAGHRHVNVVKAFVSSDPVNYPEYGFWEVETSSLRDFPQEFRTFEIFVNSDYTISIVITNVDPAVGEDTLAETSRTYAVLAQQKAQNNMSQEPTSMPDATIKAMPTGSYNAELVKQLSVKMTDKLKTLY